MKRLQKQQQEMQKRYLVLNKKQVVSRGICSPLLFNLEEWEK